MRAPPFYLVWGEDAGDERQHTHVFTAQRAADRLAMDNPGKRFFVLSPVESVVRSEIVREHYAKAPIDEDVPL